MATFPVCEEGRVPAPGPVFVFGAAAWFTTGVGVFVCCLPNHLIIQHTPVIPPLYSDGLCVGQVTQPFTISWTRDITGVWSWIHKVISILTFIILS